MPDTHGLLSKIAAFRQRLEQMPRLLPIATPSRSNLPENASPGATLENRIEAGSRSQMLLESSLRQLSKMADESSPMPSQLTSRARRSLLHARELIGRLKDLTDHPLLAGPPPGQTVAHADPLVLHHRETTAMMDSAIRLATSFPDSASAQLRLCEGLEGILRTIRLRLDMLSEVLERRSRELRQVDILAHFLTRVVAGYSMDIQPLQQLAEDILAEDPTSAMKILSAAPDASQAVLGGPEFAPPARFVACHSLNTARVLVRMLRFDTSRRESSTTMILAALLHDLGMLEIPVELLKSDKPLTPDQRRIVESHVRLGANRISSALPMLSGVAEITLQHHERMDGTGYPLGLTPERLGHGSRLLMLADVYAAQCEQRSHRTALDPRTAFTDTLLMMEKGQLDSTAATLLMNLGFYPVGSVVELADGSVGVVLTTPDTRKSLNPALRPLLLMLTDSEGKLLAVPRPLNLAETEGYSIIRTLPSEQRVRLLAGDYPQWAA